MAVDPPAWSPPYEGGTANHLNGARINHNAVVASNAIQSANYVAGVSGWSINADGDVEFDDGTFRGELSASRFEYIAIGLDGETNFRGFLGLYDIGSSDYNLILANITGDVDILVEPGFGGSSQEIAEDVVDNSVRSARFAADYALIAGSVGVNYASRTTIPSAALHVKGYGLSTPDFRIDTETLGTVDGWVDFHSNTSAGAYNPIVSAGDKAIIFSDNAIDTGELVIAPWASTASGIRITSSGNVGIDNNNPVYKLDVVGSIRSSYRVRVESDQNEVVRLEATSTTARPYVAFHGYNGSGYVRRGYVGYASTGAATSTLYFSNDNGPLQITATNDTVNLTPQASINGGPVLSDPSSANELRVTTVYGYIDIGPKNGSYCHIYTDITGGFYFNEPINADGGSTIRGGLTATGTLTLSQDGQDVLNFSANDTNDNRGIAFNSRTALSADYNDGWLRLNNAGEFSNGIYTPGNFRADGLIRIDSSRGITNVTGNYGTIQTDGSGVGNWEGYSINGWVVFMASSSTGNFGIYDDTYNHWAIYGDFNAWVQLNYDNSARVQTSSAGVNIWKTLRLLAATGNEGGEVQFDPGSSYTSSAGTYFHDMYLNAHRFFRSGGTGSFHLEFASGLPGTTAGSYLRVYGNRLYYYSSVAEIKEDMYDSGELLEYLNERNPIHSIRPHIFHMKPLDNGDGTFTERSTGNFHHGFIADDFADAIPEAQTADGSGNLGGFDDAAISSLLTAEMQRIVPMLEELYAAAHPDWVPPQPRPPERIENEKAIFEAYLVEEKAKWDETQAQIQAKHPGPSDPPPEAEIPDIKQAERDDLPPEGEVSVV